MLRELWSTLYAGAARRRRTADHERIFFQLLGYTLRPGFGYPLDNWRVEQAFKLFDGLVQFHGEKANWGEFWILWRRSAGGLSSAMQQKLWGYLRPYLERRLRPESKAPKLKGVVPENLDEMVRAAASLELLPAHEKETLGELVLEHLQTQHPTGGPWAWAIGRLGARAPIYGSSHLTVAVDTAEKWIDALIALDLKRVDHAAFAVAQLARMTQDRARDVSDATREKAVSALKAVKAPPRWVEMVTEVIALDLADQSRALGDNLPAGLSLSQS
jgi:hypothetical protein